MLEMARRKWATLRWPGKAGEKFVINSSELRAVQGRQECDFKLTLPRPPPQLRLGVGTRV